MINFGHVNRRDWDQMYMMQSYQPPNDESFANNIIVSILPSKRPITLNLLFPE